MYTSKPDRVVLKNSSTFEYIVSQLSSEKASVILCVKDGYELLVFKDTEELPKDLSRDVRITNKETGKTEYHWRSSGTQSSYVFFTTRSDTYLRNLEKENMVKVLLMPERRRTTKTVSVEYFK